MRRCVSTTGNPSRKLSIAAIQPQVPWLWVLDICEGTGGRDRRAPARLPMWASAIPGSPTELGTVVPVAGRGAPAPLWAWTNLLRLYRALRGSRGILLLHLSKDVQKLLPWWPFMFGFTCFSDLS